MNTNSIFITGAARGIGYAIATALSRPDRILFLADINAAGLNDAAQKLRSLNKEVITLSGDLSNPEVLEHTVQSTLSKVGSLDVLINNAAVSHDPKPLPELTDSDFDNSFAVNVKVPFLLIKKFLPGMRTRKNGLIINISSSANIMGYENLSIYSATKAALSSLTETVAIENKDLGIKAVSILPGRTNTQMQVQVRGPEVANASQSPDFVANIIAQVVDEKIQVKNGDDIRIAEGKFLIEEDIFSKEF